jgi:hypothetical protein
MRVEVLTDPAMAMRGVRMLEAMTKACPFPVEVHKLYHGNADLLMVYGTGHPERRPWWERHLAKGKHAIGWDLGYWQRETQSMRLTIDGDHPPQWIRPEPPERWDSTGIVLRNDYCASGPVIIVGMSAKADKVYKLGRMAWERKAAREAAKKYPNRAVLFRPKRDTDPPLPGFRSARGNIEDVLRGASLVVCRHSNVAVDACIAGVPVQCEDGAAYALYRGNPNPTPEQRLAFLRSLAYWQYRPDEASLAWTYIRNRLSV